MPSFSYFIPTFSYFIHNTPLPVFFTSSLSSSFLPLHTLLHPPFSSPLWSHLLHPRLLEHQLQTQRRSYDNEVEALRGELQNVKEENNRQQQLLAQNLQLPPEARIEASLQHEITRLTNENLVRWNTHADMCRLQKDSRTFSPIKSEFYSQTVK